MTRRKERKESRKSQAKDVAGELEMKSLNYPVADSGPVAHSGGVSVRSSLISDDPDPIVIE